MTSEIRTNSITSRAGLSTVTMTDSGPMFSGITTFVDNSGFTFGVGGGTSIFTPATNILTLGTNNTEKVRIDANGNTNITGVTTAANFKTGVSNLHNAGLTLTGGQLDVGSNIKIGTAGVVTATSFVGSGANLTGISAGTSLSGSTNNTVCTVTGANAITGESNLTFDGSLLDVSGSARANNFYLRANGSAPSADASIFRPADNTLALATASTERLRIDSVGSIGQGTGTPRTPDGSNADNPLNGDGTNGNPVFTIYGDSPAINLVSSTTASGDYSLINFGRAGSSSNPYRAVIGYKQSDDILRINSNNIITFDTGGNINTGERLRITSDGILQAKSLSGSYYPIASVKDGSTSARAATSAWEIKKTLGPRAKTGYYYLKNPYDSSVNTWWCDMDTDGGGWILIAHVGDGGMSALNTSDGNHWYNRSNKGGFDTVGSGYYKGGGYWRTSGGAWAENTCGQLMWDVRTHGVGYNDSSVSKVVFNWGTDQALPTGGSALSNIPNSSNRRFNEWCYEVVGAPGFNPANYHQNQRSNVINGMEHFTEHMVMTFCFRNTSGAGDAGSDGPYWMIGSHHDGLHQHYEESLSGSDGVYGDGGYQVVSNEDTGWGGGASNGGYQRIGRHTDTGTCNIWLR